MALVAEVKFRTSVNFGANLLFYIRLGTGLVVSFAIGFGVVGLTISVPTIPAIGTYAAGAFETLRTLRLTIEETTGDGTLELAGNIYTFSSASYDTDEWEVQLGQQGAGFGTPADLFYVDEVTLRSDAIDLFVDTFSIAGLPDADTWITIAPFGGVPEVAAGELIVPNRQLRVQSRKFPHLAAEVDSAGRVLVVYEDAGSSDASFPVAFGAKYSLAPIGQHTGWVQTGLPGRGVAVVATPDGAFQVNVGTATLEVS